MNRLLRSLGFRIVFPTAAAMAFLGLGLYAVVLTSVSKFAQQQIAEDLELNSRAVYNLCDVALQSLLVAGHGLDSTAARLRSGRVLGEIDEYVRQNGLKAVVYPARAGGEVLLATPGAPDPARLLAAAARENAVLSFALDGTAFYARRFQFDPWKWDIVLVREGEEYAGLVREVQRAYIATGVLVVIAALAMLLYLRRVIQLPIRSIIRSIQENDVPGYKGTLEFEFLSDSIRAMTERQRSEQVKITWQATHDALTGLVNRREFERRVELALKSAEIDRKEHALLYLDLDQFKIINDTCGHVAGDELLRQLTRLLQSLLRRHDTLARLGGDEFGVLLENCPVEPALRIAETLRAAVRDLRFAWESRVFKVGVSIGLVSFGDEGLSRGELLKIADAACYIAKDQGRNRVHVYRTEDDAVGRRRREMSWVNRLQKAMAERRIVLYSQEIAPLAAGPAQGPHCELLMRLIDEEGGLVAPMAFIPAAERFHMMGEIDRHVVKLAFSYWSRTHAADRSPPLYAINLSGASIGDEGFLPFVREQLALYGVPGRFVCFEITETSAIANLGNASAFIGALKQLGCRFALDDFGSGMSSFGYLRHLAVDFLKIDGSFVKDIAEDPIDHAMVEAINRIGHVMGIRTIAEWVENDAVLEKLRGIGVDYVQGYGIGRPRPLVPEKFPLAHPAAAVSAAPA